MAYITDQTSAELRRHIRSLQVTPGWHNPVIDRLFKEITDQDAKIKQLEASVEQLRESPAATERPNCANCKDPLSAHDAPLFCGMCREMGAEMPGNPYRHGCDPSLPERE